MPRRKPSDHMMFTTSRSDGTAGYKRVVCDPDARTYLVPFLVLSPHMTVRNLLTDPPTEKDFALCPYVPETNERARYGYWEWWIAGSLVISTFIFRSDGEGLHEACTLARAKLIDFVQGRLKGITRGYVSCAVIAEGGDLPIDYSDATTIARLDA